MTRVDWAQPDGSNRVQQPDGSNRVQLPPAVLEDFLNHAAVDICQTEITA